MGILHLMGRAYMPTLDCPFQVGKREVERLKTQVAAIVVDMHAEATSEKMAMAHYLDGLVTAVAGTHTHVQTADEQILPKGTAYITDIGMTGPLHSVIGIKKELAIERFLTGMPRRASRWHRDRPSSARSCLIWIVCSVKPCRSNESEWWTNRCARGFCAARET